MIREINRAHYQGVVVSSTSQVVALTSHLTAPPSTTAVVHASRPAGHLYSTIDNFITFSLTPLSHRSGIRKLVAWWLAAHRTCLLDHHNLWLMCKSPTFEPGFQHFPFPAYWSFSSSQFAISTLPNCPRLY